MTEAIHAEVISAPPALLECYLALSIHGSNAFITANRRDVAKPDLPLKVNDQLKIKDRYFKVARLIGSHGNTVKLHAPDLEGSGKATNGETSQSIRDAKKIYDFFQALKDEGWTVEDSKFKAAHYVALGIEKPASVLPMHKAAGAYTRSTASRGDFHQRFQPPYLAMLLNLGINQKNIVLAVDEMLSNGQNLPLTLLQVQKYASEQTGKPVSSFAQVFKSNTIRAFFEFDISPDNASASITRFKPDAVNDWKEWREEKLNPQPTETPVQQEAVQEPKTDANDDNFGLDD